VEWCLRLTRDQGLDRAGVDILAAHLERQRRADAERAAYDYRVSLAQAAAIVHRSKRTLEDWQDKDGDFPLPEVQGAGGRASCWKWSAIRPYLEKKAGLILPERYPSDPFRPDYGKVDADRKPPQTARSGVRLHRVVPNPKGKAMHKPLRIEPNEVYDDGSLYLTLGLTAATLGRARRCGALRHTRQGRRVLYLGQWVLDWLKADGRQGVDDAQ